MSSITKLNITQQGEDELRQIIQNDPEFIALWESALRKNDLYYIRYVLDDWFIYTSEQMETLKEHFDEELNQKSDD